MTVGRSLWVATAALLVISACARPGDGAGASSSESAVPGLSPAPDNLVLRISQEGGFVPADQLVGRIPDASVYADGRVITPGPQIMIYPGPALPNLQVTRAGADRVAELARQAVGAGVRDGADFGSPNVADAPSTRIDAVVNGRTHSVSVEALSEASADDPGLTPAQREARAKLATFVASVRALGGGEQSTPYEAERVAALSQPYSAPNDGLPAQPEPVEWPGPALPGESMAAGIKLFCVTAAGAEAEKLLEVAADAKQNTPWTQNGEKYSVTFRPLLPDETGCADLKKAR